MHILVSLHVTRDSTRALGRCSARRRRAASCTARDPPRGCTMVKTRFSLLDVCAATYELNQEVSNLHLSNLYSIDKKTYVAPTCHFVSPACVTNRRHASCLRTRLLTGADPVLASPAAAHVFRSPAHPRQRQLPAQVHSFRKRECRRHH